MVITHCIILQELRQIGYEVHNVPRGGETTFHGPGQLVAYPIVNLRQLGLGARAFVERLEDAMVQTAGCFGIQVGAPLSLLVRHQTAQDKVVSRAAGAAA
eukprot:GHRQ01028323.1.p1 GENE.GHRQ01028323.1~~GHRQ01028323.1.p1  ORF type:complete len:100 (+),score=12.06 GHRQ01028323.1:265-564(+)